MPQLSYLDKLNPQQLLAVEHGDDPVLVLGSAGSGKTHTVAARAGHLIVKGAQPARMMLLTFTHQAAKEMRRRAARIAKGALAEGGKGPTVTFPWSGTFFSIGQKLLRIYGGRIGLSTTSTILTRSDAEDLMHMVSQKIKFKAQPSRFPGKETCLAIHSRMNNSGENLTTVLEQHYPWCLDSERQLRKLFAAYAAEKKAQNVRDFDDLLLHWVELLKHPKLAREIGDRFDHVLVDNYQDTNKLQAEILLGMKPDGRGLTVVGDDVQPIYILRPVEVRNILDFSNQFDPPATIVTLEQNYRSTQPILAASNAVIGLARERSTKNLSSKRKGGKEPSLVTVTDEADQAAYVAKQVLSNLNEGRPLRQQAVLFPSALHSDRLELELARQKIPYKKIGGASLLDAAPVKDISAVLCWAENPADRVAGLRVLQLLPWLDPVNAGKILHGLEGRGLTTTPSDVESPLNSEKAWRDLVKLMKRLHRGKAEWPAEVDLVRAWYQPHLERRYDEADARAADLDQLKAIAGSFASRRTFLTDLTLNPQCTTNTIGATQPSEDDFLTLSTIHAAKGQEWRSVFVLNAIEGGIPSSTSTSDDDIELERRLLYVAMTRAKDELVLVTPWRLPAGQYDAFGGSNVTATRTRFIPDGILNQFEQLTWPAVARR